MGGQLRFRITGTNDLSLFDSGLDLLKDSGMPWAVPLGRLLNLPNNFYLQKLLMDGLVGSRYIRAYKKHNLCRAALLVSYHDVFPVSLPQSYFTINIMPSINDSRVAHIEFDLDNNSWVEGLKFAEPGKKGPSSQFNRFQC
ncbi:hypothetical protein EV421DRAFT_1804221 [Armillaria borealis]|uniref:Uncharacterized protein n=1 Tax=Armillaria borealis TaxID=47425 RepID=A0AA39JIR2_9AGAR|nr:hypothetical protein EV421DRAFT_1804221 [Armillaria borealis]